jgi:hypothetical protein
MSLRIAFALAVIITLTAVATASAAAKKQRVPRSGPQAQAVVPRSAAPFNPYNPALTGEPWLQSKPHDLEVKQVFQIPQADP